MSRPPIDLVDTLHFVQATRNSGYRNSSSALSELVDNSLQAGANNVQIDVSNDEAGARDLLISVLDDGCGMTPTQLSNALQFGGSMRFDDRSGMGRFGMGLPNSSLSQARRVDVYTWRRPTTIWHSYLDIDELLSTARPVVPNPRRKMLPTAMKYAAASSGTLVEWRNLDRGPQTNLKSLIARLEKHLGQTFRYFLWKGKTIKVNGNAVLPYDPTFLSEETCTPKIVANQYGETLVYPVGLTDGRQSLIRARFSELPVSELGPLPTSEKRIVGIVNGAGVSIVRADREIDYGWLLMDKRRENYDDWWRCEIRFDPELDELFGVTHMKQGIRATDTLRSIIARDLGSVARTLNRRVRLAHIDLAASEAKRAAANVAARKDVLLRPLPSLPGPSTQANENAGQRAYYLATEKIDERVFAKARYEQGRLTITLNTMHEFYRDIYSPLASEDGAQARHYRTQLELLLFALGRSLQLERPEEDQIAVETFLTDWSRAISIFCGGTSR